MKCIYCNNRDTKVVDKRDLEDEPVSRRRRECLKCTKRFTTFERIEAIDIKVVKKNGNIEPYSKEKLYKGIYASGKNRISKEEVDEIVEDIELRIFNRKSSEVSSSDLGRMVLTRLKHKDKVVYMRYASVFLDFTDLDEFKHAIDKLSKKNSS